MENKQPFRSRGFTTFPPKNNTCNGNLSYKLYLTYNQIMHISEEAEWRDGCQQSSEEHDFELKKKQVFTEML